MSDHIYQKEENMSNLKQLTVIMLIISMGSVAAGKTQKPWNSVAEKELVSSLKDKSVNNAAGIANKTASFGEYRLNKNKSGYVKFIGSPPGKHFAVNPGSKGKFANKHEIADAFIENHRKLFAADSSSLTYAMKKISGSNNKSVRYNQLYGGIRVFGAEMIVQVNDESGVDCIISDIMTDSSKLDDSTVSLTPTTDSARAAEIARDFVRENYSGLNNRRYGVSNIGISAFYPEGNLLLETSNIELMIFDPSVFDKDGSVALAWKVEVSGTAGQPIKEVVIVNAHDENIEFNYSLIYDSKVREIYDSNNSTADPGILKRSEGDPASGINDVDLAYDFYGDTYDFYYNYNGRDSIDDAGMTMSATVRYCYSASYCPYPNAFWDGSRMYFGEGFVVDDIVGHELTHGVTEHESNLIYQGESGAINESLSDMWGEWIDLTNSGGTDTEAVEWLLGEDSSFGAIRCMKNPTLFGDPDRYSSVFYYKSDQDYGGVHTNSGVGNKLCYLLTDGDSFNGYTIQGEGIAFTAELFYECQVSLLTQSSNYEDLYYALIQAAINLNVTVAQLMNIQEACCAVEINMGDEGFTPRVHNINQNTWYMTISEAVQDAGDGEEIVVYPGTYHESILFPVKPITLRSTDPTNWDVVASTIIVRNGLSLLAAINYPNNSDNSNIVVKGFTLTGDGYGIASVGRPPISNCIIENNANDGIYGITGSPQISNCIIRANGRHGIYVYDDSEFSVRDCLIYSNGSSGIDHYMYVDEENPQQFLFPVIINNTIVSNAVNGINQTPMTSSIVANCILWGNGIEDIYGQATYSCIGDGDPGTGNISTNPCFIDAANGNYHLASNSPCISSGTNSAVISGEVDIDGQTRILHGTVDMGADEFKRTVHNVSQNAWYLTIQAAINAAGNGNELVVYPGIYKDEINFAGKSITLRSSNPDDWDVVGATIIDTSNEFVDTVTFSSGENSASVLEGFTLKTYGSSFGIYCTSSSPTIRKCIIEGSMYGIICAYSSFPEISDCIVRNSSMGGIDCYASSPTISNCILANNTGYYGINCYYYSSPVIRNCTIVNNCSGINNYLGSPVITNCILWGNADSDLDGCSATYSCIQYGNPGTGNISTDPLFVASDPFFHLASNSPCINTGNPSANYTGQMDIDGDVRVIDGRADIGADELGKRVHNLNQNTWYLTIQAAIDEAVTGDQIVVSPGLYIERVNFNGKAITVRGSDPDDWEVVESTVIDATNFREYGYGEDCVTFNHGESYSSVLNGIKIITGSLAVSVQCNGASPTISNCIMEYGQFGVSGSNSSPEISHCIIRNITMTGISCYGYPIIHDCIVEFCDYSGIDCGYEIPTIYDCIIRYCGNGIGCGGFAIVRDCTVIYNSGDGINIGSDYAQISNCVVVKNAYDGIRTYCSPYIRNCIMIGNMAGVFCGLSASPTISNCLSIYNRESGIFCRETSYPLISNSTIVGNYFGVLSETNTNDTFTNSIFWENIADEIYGSATITYSVVEGGYSGTGNINSDPLFVPSDPIFHITSSSPCINTGDPSGNYTGQTDIDNESRVLQGRVDIGADETNYPWTLTSSSSDNGNVTTPGEGTFVYNHGTVVSIAATADTNYHFVNWTGTAVTAGKVANPASASTTVTMDGNYTIIANFVIDPPAQAGSPAPTNGAGNVSLTQDISWTAGNRATSHDVYFGTVNPPPFIANQTAATFDTGTMNGNTTYYWRIDEKNAGGTTTGIVWSFTTLDPTPTYVGAGIIASGATSITPALPSGIVTGDILLMFIETANQAITVSNPNGGTWTGVTNSPQGTGTAASSTATRLTVFWSRYNGTQGAPTISDSGDHQAARMIAVRGAVASGNPWDVTAGGVEGTSDTSGSIPGATTTVNNTLIITAIAAALPDSTNTANFESWTNANLTSITERVDNAQKEGNGGSIGIVTGIRSAAGAYGNTAVTLATAAYKGIISIAIKP
jgi:parallel beta-helix repeat protein